MDAKRMEALLNHPTLTGLWRYRRQGEEPSWCATFISRDGLAVDTKDYPTPWSAWPCDDLWNLMPASPRVNRDLKRDRLPSTYALASARESILRWWQQAWADNPALTVRFQMEAVAALPVEDDPGREDVFSGLEWRRLRLRLDQQVEEWEGMT